MLDNVRINLDLPFKREWIGSKRDKKNSHGQVIRNSILDVEKKVESPC